MIECIAAAVLLLSLHLNWPHSSVLINIDCSEAELSTELYSQKMIMPLAALLRRTRHIMAVNRLQICCTETLTQLATYASPSQGGGEGSNLHFYGAFMSLGASAVVLCHLMHSTGLVHRAVRLQMLLTRQTPTSPPGSA